MNTKLRSRNARSAGVQSAAILFPLLLFVFGCVRPIDPPGPAPSPDAARAELPAIVPDVRERLAQIPATEIDYDRSLLSAGERAVVAKLIEAAKVVDRIFWLQVSEKNAEWNRMLESTAPVSPDHAAAWAYFHAMKGPWDRLAEDEPFLLAAGPKPPGAAYYPPDMTKEELERWLAEHPEDEEAFRSLHTVIRRYGDRLAAVPYSTYYRGLLTEAAARMREAAALTGEPTLRDFLEKRAEAFFTDDYYESDLAWMDLEGPIEVVIGPYEVYEDSLFNYKAAFESFITVVDRPESEKLAVYAQRLPDLERNLPIPDEHKNPNRGSESPIRVVQEIYTAGDARSGVQTAAFNLPNDERVREAKGSKKVLLRNVMEAKFQKSGKPISERVLVPEQVGLVSNDAYFNHVLFHELTHGIGPGIIVTASGERVDTRLLLKELYSPIEEAKADVTGIWSALHAMDRGWLAGFSREELYATVVGMMFRSMRFGLDGAHGRGNAVQWNWFRERGAIAPAANGRFRVEMALMDEAVRSLAHELLMIEATGDYDRARRLLERYGVTNAEIRGVIARLTDIPVDIRPVFVAAGERMP
ncbi:MAG TPA: peptidase [Thermoanaerobaculia bacterium]|nr:peptidase [Thermoanaerobaculia bacterium]